MVLIHFHIDFNPWKEKLEKRNLWVLLPGFPLPCWNLVGFMAVAKDIGRFILIEEDFLIAIDRCLPRMLVEVDISKVLPVDLEFVWEGGSFLQKLD